MSLRVILFFILLFIYANADNKLIFSVSRTGEPHLDPHRAQGDLELHLNPNIYEGLYKIEPDTGKLIPALATAHRWINDKILEFDLRKGVVFHNGEKFDAKAVKLSFERMASIEDGFNWIKAIAPEFESVEIINQYRIRIHFKKHNSIFLISSRFFVILPPKLIQKSIDYAVSAPIGTGPFIAKKIIKKNGKIVQITLQKNDLYYDKRYPKLKTVEFLFGMSQEDGLKALKTGKIDAMADIPIRSLLDVKKEGLILHTKGQGLLSWLYFNLTKEKKNSPIYDKRVRQAILHAIDYQKILRVVYKKHASINHQWAFPNLPGYSNNLSNYDYNITKAKMLLKEAHVKEGTMFYMYCDDVSLDEAKIIKSSLNAIGLDVSIDILDEATNNCILTAKNNPKSKCYNKLSYYDFMSGDFGWGLPHNYVSHLHSFSQNSFASLVDASHPSAKESDKLFSKAVHSALDSNKKWEAVTEFEYDRLSITGLFLKETFYATRKGLKWDVYGSYDFTKANYE